MKILIFGAGAVGGYFGGKLFISGFDVTFLVRASRKKKLLATGLKIFSPHGDFSADVKCKTVAESAEIYDLVLLCCKAYQLENAIKDLKSFLKKPAYILPILNGLSHIGELRTHFGKEKVFGGTAHIASTVSEEGYIKQLNPIQVLTAGCISDNQGAAILNKFIHACNTANFKAMMVEDIMQSMWDKWSFLATLAGSTVLFRNSVGAITDNSWGAELMLRMYKECLDVANASGYKVSNKAEKKALGILMEPGSDFTASMLRDLLTGAPTEHEHILGNLVKMGRQFNIDMPLISAAYVSAVSENSDFRSGLLDVRS